jgi:hypothetical protein
MRSLYSCDATFLHLSHSHDATQQSIITPHSSHSHFDATQQSINRSLHTSFSCSLGTLYSLTRRTRMTQLNDILINHCASCSCWVRSYSHDT